MKVTKRDIYLVNWAIDICETNLEAGDENPESEDVAKDLKKLLAKMKKDNPKE